jgi:hypothetical protein
MISFNGWHFIKTSFIDGLD